MPREFELPDVGEGVHEGELVEWLVEPGDTVAEDEPVAKVETDKALVDVPSPFHGTVRELRWEEGDVVPVGDVLLVFNVEGEDDDAIAAGETEGGDAGGAASGEDAAAESGGEPERSASGSPPPAGSPEAAEAASAGDSGRVFAAPSARRVARELGVNVRAVEGSGPGGRVTEQDVRAAAEAAEEPAVEEADAGTAETPEVSLESDEEAGGGIEAAVDAGVEGGADAAGGEQVAVQSEPAADRDRTLAAPATRTLAEDHGVELDSVPATEERDGEPFVTPEAVVEYAEAQQQAQAADAEAVEAGGPSAGTETAGSAQPPAAGE